MTHFLHGLAHVLMVVFAIGVAGCLVAIPIVAFKFLSVLFERDADTRDANTNINDVNRSVPEGKAS